MLAREGDPPGPPAHSSVTGPWPRPVRPRLPGQLAYRLQRVLAPNAAYLPSLRCVWVVAYERAEREGRVADLLLVQRPVDHRRSGQSAWVSYWQGDDETLWAPPAAGTVAEDHR